MTLIPVGNADKTLQLTNSKTLIKFLQILVKGCIFVANIYDNLINSNVMGEIKSGFDTKEGILYTKPVNIYVLLEGLTNPTNGLLYKAQDENGNHFAGDTADLITVGLASISNPNLITDLFDTKIQTNGKVSFFVPLLFNDSNYIVIKHRNHLETWSAMPVSFATDTVNYNFIPSASKAFGNNQKLVANGKYGIMVGDTNQDGVVDISDLVAMDADLTNGTLGYIVYDLNGDGVVDLSDLVKIDENLTNGAVVITP